MMTPTLPRLYPIRTAARVLQVSDRTLWRMIAAGDVRTVKLRGAVRIPVEEIERLCGAGAAQAS
jgi:excisionase family DNA binding protein